MPPQLSSIDPKIPEFESDLNPFAELYPFIQKYYIDPIIMDSGYNPVNTVTWAIILGIFLLLIIRAFRRLDIRIDGQLIVATIPFVVAGSAMRVVEDAGLLPPPASYLLITPLIYVLVASVTIAALALSRSLTAGYRAYVIFGVVWAAAVLAVLLSSGLARPWIIPAVILLGSGITAVLYQARSRLTFLSDKYNLMIILAHMLDASSTYIGVDLLGYSEKHVVPTMLIDATGTGFVMYPLKMAVLLPVLALMNGALKDDDDLAGLIRLTLLILGLAPAVRNTLRMTIGI